MNLATLFVEGESNDLNIIANQLDLKQETQWEKGGINRKGNIHSTSGFQTTIADADDTEELMNSIRSFLDKCKNRKIVFSPEIFTVELSLGFTVGDSEQYAAGVSFSPLELLMLSESNITLSFNAYPTSDEANEN